MFEHLCATILNIVIGNDGTPVYEAKNAANVWFYNNSLGSCVTADSVAWQDGGEAIKKCIGCL